MILTSYDFTSSIYLVWISSQIINVSMVRRGEPMQRDLLGKLLRLILKSPYETCYEIAPIMSL